MSIVIDANKRLFANKLQITSSRMIDEYGLDTVEQIIRKEAKKGNTHAVNYAMEYHYSSSKLIELFNLHDVENRYQILRSMDEVTRNRILPFLSTRDMVMGLHFFTQEKLLKLLLKTDIGELIAATLTALPFKEVIKKFKDEDLSKFFLNKKVRQVDVVKQLRKLPTDVMKRFVEGVTGRPSEQTNPDELITSIGALPENQFKKFMSAIDPEVQRQLVFQLAEEEPAYLSLFDNQVYVDMMATVMKPDMVASMVMLKDDTLRNMLKELPADYLSIVGSQAKADDLAYILLDGNMKYLDKVHML